VTAKEFEGKRDEKGKGGNINEEKDLEDVGNAKGNVKREFEEKRGEDLEDVENAKENGKQEFEEKRDEEEGGKINDEKDLEDVGNAEGNGKEERGNENDEGGRRNGESLY